MSSFTDVTGPVGPLGPPGPQGPQGPGLILAHSETVYSTYMIAGEQQIARYTIPANFLKAGDRLRFHTWAYGQNPTSQVFYTHRWKLGATTFLTSTGIASTVTSGLFVTRFEMEMHLESLTAQRARAWILVGGPTPTAGAMIADVSQQQGSNSMTANLANATDLVFTVTPDRTLGDAYMAYAGWWLQYLPS